MLDYRKCGEDIGKTMFEYFVEGRSEERGTVILDHESGEAVVDELASTDKFSIYAMHLLSQLRKEAREGNVSDSGTVAWY
jgi:hypothetical protein